MQREYKIVKLYFKEPIALMAEKKDEFQNEVTLLPSDMLKAALLSALARVGTPEEVNLFNFNVKISSGFLFYNSHYFFPKPMIKLAVKEQLDPKQAKKIKNIKYIVKEIFEKIIQQQQIKIDEKNFLHNGKILVSDSKGFPVNLYRSQTEERVSIGNTHIFSNSEKGSPYYISRTYFYRSPENLNQTGIYFIYEGDDDLMRKALNILQDEGIGADRKIGNGHFEYEMGTFNLNLPVEANKQMLLSYFIPTQDEIKSNILFNGNYQLEKRGGFVSGTLNENFAHWLKKNIFMIKNAAVFDNNMELKGKNTVLSTQELENLIGHKVYRDGRALSIPIQAD